MNKKLASLALAAGLFLSGPALVEASPLDAIVGFYTSALPKPPQIPVDVAQVHDLITTGDIIIENDRAFAQWYVAIAALVPQTKFVHSGLVITGEDLQALNQRLKDIFKGDDFEAIKPHKWQKHTFTNKRKKIVTTWRWMPFEFDISRKYVITPAGVGEKSENIVAVFDLHDYLVHPAYGSSKHIQVIRPAGLSEEGKNKIVDYLGLHLFKKTGYDMGFSLNEKENDEGLEQLKENEYKTVPVYCTELCLRAWNKAGISVPIVKLDKGLLGKIRGIPGLPKSFVAKTTEDFITADCFAKAGTILYQNELPPAPGKAFGAIIGGNLKAFGDSMKEKFAHLFR